MRALAAALWLGAAAAAAQAQPALHSPAVAPERGEEPGDAASLPRAMPRWLLQAGNGRTVSPEDYRGRFQLLAFGFVSCPSVCPTTLLEMQQVLQALGPQAAKVQPLFISVDPERDTLLVLREYTAPFDKRIVGLTGPPLLIERAAQAFKVRYEKILEPGAAPGSYTMDHTAGMFLVGPDGQLLSRIGFGVPVPEIVARIQRWMTAAER